MENAIQNFEKAIRNLVKEIWKRLKPVYEKLKSLVDEQLAKREKKAVIADEDRPRTFLDEDQDIDNDADRIATAVVRGLNEDYARLRTDIIYDPELKKVIKRAIKKELK